METNTTVVANAEPGVQTEDFAQRVRVNHAKLASELRPHNDFIVCGSGSSGFGGNAPAFQKSGCHALGLEFKDKGRLTEFLAKIRERFPDSERKANTLFSGGGRVITEWTLTVYSRRRRTKQRLERLRSALLFPWCSSDPRQGS
jgi:hypothetical protein